jgi:hypothetical protein
MPGLLLMLALWLAAPAAAWSADLSRDAMERALAVRRVTAAYLRTENADLALLQLERLQKALSGSTYEALVARAAQAAERGELATAAQEIAVLGQALAKERARNGLRLFTDCILEFSAAQARLDRFRSGPPNLRDALIIAEIAAAAKAGRAALARCDAEAPPDIGQSPEFRRLADGALASLESVIEAASRQEIDKFLRILSELRSFEQLLLFRYG